MSRIQNARSSVSPVRSIHSDESDNFNINDELPALQLPKSKNIDDKEQRKVSFDFPVDVITKSGKFSGTGTINLIDEALETRLKLHKTKAELKEVLTQFEQDFGVLMEREQADERTQIHPVKEQPPVEEEEDAERKTKQAKRREVEAKRDAIRKAIEHEKQAKVALVETKRIYKPGECRKHLTLELHPFLLSEWFMAPTLASAREVGVHVAAVEEMFDPGLVIWSRSVPAKLHCEAGEVRVAPTRTQSPHCLLVMTLQQMTALAAQACLLQHVLNTTRLAPGCRALILLTQYQGTLTMTREQIGKTICELQIELLMSRKVDVRCAKSATEMHDIIMHYTKAVAEEPYKRAKREVDEQACFYMRGDNKNCVIVDKQGNGLSRLWEQMLGVLPHSSLEVARTLGTEYTTPAALVQALQSPGGVGRVADIGVARTNVPGAKTRRLGPEFARKLHTLFTTEDGNAIIE